MEDTLRVPRCHTLVKHNIVLILVLMEDTLRDKCLFSYYSNVPVLILVLMEDTLRGGYYSSQEAIL